MSDKPTADEFGMDGLSVTHIEVELQKSLGASHIAAALANQESPKPVAKPAQAPAAPSKQE